MLRRLLSPDAASGGGAAAASSSASATPAAAPTKPAAAPAAPPPKPDAPVPDAGGDDPFAAADAKMSERRAKARAEAEAKAKAKPDAEPDPNKKKDDTDPAAAADLAPDPAKGDRTFAAKDPKALRQQYDKVNGELAAAKKETADLQAKIKDFETKNKDTTALAEQLATAQKERESLQAEIRALKQEVSPEFKEKFETPFNEAAEFSKQQIEQLTFNEDGNPRQATWNDFIALYRMPYNKAVALAKEQFGDAAPEVMSHIRDLQKLEFRKNQALQAEKAQWKERESKATAEQAQRTEAVKAAWEKVNADLVEKNEDYREDPKDEEANTLRREAYALFDGRPATLQQRILKDAHIRHRTAAYPVLKLQVSRLTDKVAELEAALKEAKESGPGPTLRRGGGDGGTGEPKGWKQDLKDTMGS